MDKGLKACIYCAEEIKIAAILCKHCRKTQPGHEPAKKAAPKKRPWIGFVGILIMMFSCVLAFVIQAISSYSGFTIGMFVFIVGLLTLMWALFTGNLKLFG